MIALPPLKVYLPLMKWKRPWLISDLILSSATTNVLNMAIAQTLKRRRILQCLIWVFAICKCSFLDFFCKCINHHPTIAYTLGREAQSVTCLATDASLTADPEVASLISARSHTFVEIDHEIISTVFLLPSAVSFKKSCCQLQVKVCARSIG